MILHPIPGYVFTDDNQRRAFWARSAVEAWFSCDETRPDTSWYPDDQDATDDMRDTLGDLLHLLAQHGVDPHVAVETALANYDCEARGEPSF